MKYYGEMGGSYYGEMLNLQIMGHKRGYVLDNAWLTSHTCIGFV